MRISVCSVESLSRRIFRYVENSRINRTSELSISFRGETTSKESSHKCFHEKTIYFCARQLFHWILYRNYATMHSDTHSQSPTNLQTTNRIEGQEPFIFESSKAGMTMQNKRMKYARGMDSFYWISWRNELAHRKTIDMYCKHTISYFVAFNSSNYYPRCALCASFTHGVWDVARMYCRKCTFDTYGTYGRCICRGNRCAWSAYS